MKETNGLLSDDRMQFAVLIDADNVPSQYAKSIFEELEKYGRSSYQRIYGNWAKSNGWTEQILLEYSIIPVQQFSYTVGKNSTDIAMVIDAMDILYKNKVQGFCLVTSDSDFTRLAMRLREENMFVLGMGESKTPLAMTRACNRFIHLDLVDENEKIVAENSIKRNAEQSVTSLSEIKETILTMINESDGGIVDLSRVGNRLYDKFSDFDVRNYGYAKLRTLIEQEMPEFRLKTISGATHCYVEQKLNLTKTDLEKEICAIIKKHGGKIEPLSTLSNELRDKHKQLNFKQFGYSRISSFLRSMESVTVKENQVSLKKKN